MRIDGRVRRTFSAGAIALVVLAGCGPATDPPAAPEGEATSSPADAPLPSNPSQYADALLAAWADEDADEVARLATREVVDELSGHGALQASPWERVASEGAAGSTYVTYQNMAEGGELTLRVSSEAAAAGETGAVVEAIFEL